MLEQLGNLPTAGKEIAEARERAARAEEREAFAQQRRQEAENRARVLEEELSRVTNPEPTTGGTEPEPIEPARTSSPGFVRSLIRRVRSR